MGTLNDPPFQLSPTASTYAPGHLDLSTRIFQTVFSQHTHVMSVRQSTAYDPNAQAATQGSFFDRERDRLIAEITSVCRLGTIRPLVLPFLGV